MNTPETNRYHELIDKSFNRGTIEADDIRCILTSGEVELLPLLHDAYQILYRYFRNRVKIHIIIHPQILTPQYCLQVLCLFRFAVPQAEIRASAGREYHMRSLQSLCLYAANSLFAENYLTAGGDTLDTIRQLVQDSGFIVEELE